MKVISGLQTGACATATGTCDTKSSVFSSCLIKRYAQVNSNRLIVACVNAELCESELF